jgi:hypothetical protein
MDTMELERWYSLDECTNRKLVLKQLKDLQKEGKIDFDLDKSTDVFEIEDLDLEDDMNLLMLELGVRKKIVSDPRNKVGWIFGEDEKEKEPDNQSSWIDELF